MKKFYILFILFTFLILNLHSQNPPCAQNFPYITYHTPSLSLFPPYSLDMPYDILLAYVALDTISHYSNPYKVSQFLNRQTFNDTLQTIMRYYYEMKDYNPIRYTQSEFYSDNSMHCILPNIALPLCKNIREKSPNHLLDYMLCSSDYILQIKAKKINVVIDTTTSGLAREVREIYCEILDTIKGQIIPYIIDNNNLIISKGQGNNSIIKAPMPVDTSLVFQYSPYWGNLVDSNGQPWIKIDSEYIVFLSCIACCQDTSEVYFNIRPIWPESKTFGMYPIINGVVFDPVNEFGFGKGLTATEFKNQLRLRINQIISY